MTDEEYNADKGVSLIYERNRIIVKGYNRPKCVGWLPYVFTVYDNLAHRYVKDKTYSYLDKKSGDIIIPRTSDVSRVISRVKSQGLWYHGSEDKSNENIIEYRPFTSPINVKSEFGYRDEFQKDAVYFMTKRPQDNIHYRLVSLPPGEGKTFCAIEAMCKYNRKTLIVASSLVDQWAREILHFTDIDYKKIYEIKDNVKSLKDLLTNKYNYNSYDVYIASLRTLANSVEDGSYGKFLTKMGIGLKIVDEIHLQTYTNLWLDMQEPIQETIYLSATPGRSAPNEDYVLRLVFKNLPEYGNYVEEKLPKYLNAIYVYFDSNPTFMEANKCNTMRGFSQVEYAKHIFSEKHVEQTFDMIKWAVDISLKTMDSDEKMVIIFELSENVEFVKRVLEKMYPDVSVGNYTGSGPHKKDELNNRIILTTDSSFGTGSDLKGKLRVLLNTTTYSSQITARQLPKRLRAIPDKSVYYIDMVNTGFSGSMRQYNNRSRIINKYALTINKRYYNRDIKP